MKKKLFDFSNRFRVVRAWLSHLTMFFALLMLICFIIDRVNTAMEFISSDISKWCIAILAFLALVSSILNIIGLWVNPDKTGKTDKK